MATDRRIELIKQIEDIRGSQVVCYLTSVRPNVPSQISDDAVRVFFDHLALLPSRPVEKLDLFLCSNGGSGTVPWRLVSLFREYAKSFSVLIPYRAYSAASLIALGADEIVMHPFAELGPIDPTVSNDFNPKEDQTGRVLGISVEDVKAYINFIKTTVGITHEDELVRAIEILAQKVHPLALGNVERFLSQSRMIARKILKTHQDALDDHAIEEIVENMASKLYFHGHPINRDEAKRDLRLKVAVDLPPALEAAMWALYQEYETEFQNRVEFTPVNELWKAEFAGGLPPGQLPTYNAQLLHVMIESSRLLSSYRTEHRFIKLPAQPGQISVIDAVLAQGWSHSPAPQAPSQAASVASGPAGAPSPAQAQPVP